jgi:pSer/pThr/pTyr-binding forkhead associated (FHA) protein
MPKPAHETVNLMLTIVSLMFVLLLCSALLLALATWAWRAAIRFDKGMLRAYAETAWRAMFPARAVGWEVLERRILTKMRRGVTISVSGVSVVPRSFRVSLAPEDMNSMSGVLSFVEDNLSRRLTAEARRHGWRCASPPTVRFHADPTVPRGLPLVEAIFSDANIEPQNAEEPDASSIDLPLSPTERLPRTRTRMDEPPQARTADEGPLVHTQPWIVTELASMDGDDASFDLSDRTDDVLIGREPDCDMVLEVPTVSNRHCRLRRTDDGWAIEDLGSLNATFRNGTRITEAVMLAHGDYLSFGRGGPRFLYSRFDSSLPVRRRTRRSGS